MIYLDQSSNFFYLICFGFLEALLPIFIKIERHAPWHWAEQFAERISLYLVLKRFAWYTIEFATPLINICFNCRLLYMIYN